MLGNLIANVLGSAAYEKGKEKINARVEIATKETQPEPVIAIPKPRVFFIRSVVVPVAASGPITVRFRMSPDYFFIWNLDPTLAAIVNVQVGNGIEGDEYAQLSGQHFIRLPSRGAFEVTLLNTTATAVRVTVIAHDEDMRIDAG